MARVLSKTVFAAVIQHKVLQKLGRLDETEVEVAESDKADLSTNQPLAIEYHWRYTRCWSIAGARIPRPGPPPERP
ncbi:unnamed protein product [Clonostachys rhizophaga]|uniref:Uncharacterized protein n=1 Tax=Clonostachys rhizophaga TaxID=160324 RepID=A0A9N9YVP2_9HYPO|nr:unnamed protein product [Clonostachys rhizophaga]